MSEELKSAREFAEAVAEWVQGGSPLDDVAVEHLTGVILSRDKLIEETAFRKAASYLRGLRKTPGGFDLYHTEMQVLAKVADGLERASLAIPTDQSALVRVEAAAYARAKRDAAQAAESEIEDEFGNINDSPLKTIRRVVRAILALQDRGREADKEEDCLPYGKPSSGPGSTQTKEGKEAISIEEAKAITDGYPPSSGPGRSGT